MIKLLLIASLVFNTGTEYERGRIGIKHRDGKIISVCRVSPANRVGILAGDKVIAVDGKNGYRNIKGEVGTTVNLTIRRSSSTLNFVVVRASEKDIQE
jgi:C-terminal processing protease CtpA/Prc